jgi:HSP90 family molecular chaperone
LGTFQGQPSHSCYASETELIDQGDTGSGVSYRAIMYIPAQLPKDFWQKIASGLNNVRLMVKRVFITDDMGDEFMPRWLSFLKVTVDADDLPLVSSYPFSKRKG